MKTIKWIVNSEKKCNKYGQLQQSDLLKAKYNKLV